jgi:hypothetical protein
MTQQTTNDLTPMVTGDYEPAIAIDLSGSMGERVNPNEQTTKFQLVTEVLGVLVERLAGTDSQAGHETAGDEDEGGLWAAVFSSSGRSIGDLNPQNWRAKWASAQPGGGTYICTGWDQLERKYQQEFGGLAASERPARFWLFISDGQPSDERQFEQRLANAPDNLNVAVAVTGYGPEHDQAVAAYQRIASTRRNVRAITFGTETNPTVIADAVLGMMGK